MHAQILSLLSDPSSVDSLRVAITLRNTSDKPVTLTLKGGSVRITIRPKTSIRMPMDALGLLSPVRVGRRPREETRVDAAPRGRPLGRSPGTLRLRAREAR